MGYAEKTKVPVNRTRDEIEKTLMRYGADKFFFGTSQKGSGIAFEYNGVPIKISVPNPDTGIFVDGSREYEQERRRMWRVLLLALKAKLEMIDANLTTFEDEFLSQTALPNGQNVGE